MSIDVLSIINQSIKFQLDLITEKYMALQILCILHHTYFPSHIRQSKVIKLPKKSISLLERLKILLLLDCTYFNEGTCKTLY